MKTLENYRASADNAARYLFRKFKIHLGASRIIITSAVGSLVREMRVGDVAVVNGLIQLFVPPLPLCPGEFCSPEDALDPTLRLRALDIKDFRQLHVKLGGHAMVRGPNFEGRKYDKAFLAKTGASVVGMSMLPEAAICSLYLDEGVQALGLGFVTNDAVEAHSHELNQKRARDAQSLLGAYLTELIASIRPEEKGNL